MAQSSSYTEAELTRNNVKCKFKYRIRWFYSRGSFLVLIWNILILAAVSSSFFFFQNMFSEWNTQVESVWLLFYSVPFIVFLVCAPLCGWLADARFGNTEFSKLDLLCYFLLW